MVLERGSMILSLIPCLDQGAKDHSKKSIMDLYLGQIEVVDQGPIPEVIMEEASGVGVEAGAGNPRLPASEESTGRESTEKIAESVEHSLCLNKMLLVPLNQCQHQ